MSTNKEKLIERLTNTKDGFELVDVKFSMGSDRFISEDRFCETVLEGLAQVESGLIKSVEPKEIDGSFKSRTVEGFLA